MNRRSKEYLQTIFHLHLAKTVSYFCLAFGITLFYVDKEAGIKRVLQSIRFYGANTAAIKFLHLNLEKINISNLVSQDVDEKVAGRRSIVLSEPIINNGKVTKKGVLLITFTRTFCSVLKSKHFANLNDRYLFVLEPSWTGYADADILAFCSSASDLVIQATDIDDRTLINTLYPDVVTLDTGASNWVQQEFYSENGHVEKDIDILYVANNNPVKRVYRFIDVIHEIHRDYNDIKVMLICAGWGGSSDGVMAYINKMGLGNCIEISKGVPKDELVKLYNRSKISVLFSLKEGSNRVLFESMACNTPVICLSENRGVNKAYINEQTGLIVPDRLVKAPMLWLLDNYQNFSPRAWALKNISPKKSEN